MQRIDAEGHAAASGSSEAHAAGSSSSSSSGKAPLQRAGSSEMGARAEAACSKLLQGGVADAVLAGHVGDCCDGIEAVQDARAAARAAAAAAAPGIVPFNAQAAAGSGRRRTAVRAAAISAAAGADVGAHAHTGVWGLVVQSRLGVTGAEGCYLLKAVRNMSATGCHCTHFSLTRVTQGGHLESQFVRSWLV